ncbi:MULTISPECIES: FAD-dependent oxidoreductase [Clostridium]|uniref:Flavo-diiron protein FprA1 n=1 Tax=Clostridium saccharoperbutylacetonicum N1-4(HMT) TaxID=931276 RepID=M1M9J6_9CLOT|nr:MULTISPECIES: FAD-dependent oxidoreductase [Clostridium]AGF54624.1 flavo-diiron protein FprA1 [Clostridium saccharoperbutylacetonicum N1-4(HMT)]AQR93579.1 flavo-diiron protein FprA1 [Clostridium saccharoperbutylacetonicum]NRT58855.1 flavorubredoxin/NADPH-dependent 2,4-dienoyl-CoA reductase/sulfur reductase-like enzyme [Clostridium saccharoperbutylacetonicum]NSB29278.1 flavorubredoxin/NADPH-dependent 2,4-dienoyl-CoA reductase/sulfur reductase-like enzyme [Clostridium saccharoperbutylacetonicu
MEILELKKDFYWTGVLDKDLKVFDIIMETEFGSSYNSYLLKTSDKTVLFETAKAKFFDGYLNALEKLVDIKDIDYIVVNHTEPDHAGSIEKLIEINPNIKIVGTQVAIGFLKNIVNRDFYSITVKENDTLNVGDKTLRFMMLPNLHWPDTMYTYIEEDKTLLTCDSFGSHYCFDEILLSKVTDNEGYLRATKYYFDCIIGPFKNPFMVKALNRIKDLEIDMICTGHGPVIDCRIDEIIELYKKWCTVVNPNTKKTVIIPYVSAYGYTKELAGKITEGIKASGDIDVRSYDLVEDDKEKVLEELTFADGILFGTPTIVGEALEPIWELTIKMFARTHGGKLASAFGSYGWSGEGVPHIMQRLKQLNMKIVEGLRIKFKPSDNDLSEAYDFGYNFGCVLQNKENPAKKSAKRTLVKCLVCGEIFDSSLEICPVCGVGKENFIEVDDDESDYKKNTDEIYLILGNGAAGVSAATAIRQRNETCSIVMVSNESILGYNRPMLTKSIIAKFRPKQILMHDKYWYKEKNITNVLDKEIIKLDTKEKEVIFNDGIKLKYDKCIYALGSECFVPPITGIDKKAVIAIRRVSDVDKIIEVLPKVKNVVIIGGGVLGLEAAWELSKTKCKVTVLEIADTLMGTQLDHEGGKFLEEVIKGTGIDIRLNVKIDEILGKKLATGVKINGNETLEADLIIVSCGIVPNSKIAKEAGINSHKSVLVNEKMETNVADIYACGDCAEYDGINYGTWPQALEMGKVAGANAAGDSLKYETVDAALTFSGMNTSIYAIGDNGKNPYLKYKTVEFKDPIKKIYEKYYFANNRLCGAILIGDTKKIVKVTQDVKENKLFTDVF